MKRRESLAFLAAGASSALALSCAPARPPDRRVRVPRERLRAEGRIEAEYAGDPVEVRETAGGPVARSLLCTHFGCRVQWEAQTASFHCPCHDGRFDGEGRPVAGPPLQPLRSLRVEIEGDVLLVGDA
jgi:cytochrome b6-f complex iron-sulfur subunit